MAVRRKAFISLIAALLLQGNISVAAENASESDLWFFVLVKSSNYSQSQDGELTLLNYHFFSELFGKEPGLIKSATLQRSGTQDEPYTYVDRGESFYYEGGHYKTVEGVDAAHPNGNYHFNITLSSGNTLAASLDLSGPEGKTDIPAPIQIYLHQQGALVQPAHVDPQRDLRVSWSPYSNGSSDPNGIVDDMIFIVFQNCRGERIFHTGLPFKESNYMTYASTEAIVPAGRFEAGHSYAMFVEFPHRVDSVLVGSTPGFTSYATATYMDIDTTGQSKSECPDAAMPLDTGQTDRMDVEIH